MEFNMHAVRITIQRSIAKLQLSDAIPAGKAYNNGTRKPVTMCAARMPVIQHMPVNQNFL